MDIGLFYVHFSIHERWLVLKTVLQMFYLLLGILRVLYCSRCVVSSDHLYFVTKITILLLSAVPPFVGVCHCKL